MRRLLTIPFVLLVACDEPFPYPPIPIDGPSDEVDAPVEPRPFNPNATITLQQEDTQLSSTFRSTKAFAVFGQDPPPTGCNATTPPPVGVDAGSIHITGTAVFDMAPIAVEGGFVYQNLETPDQLLVPNQTITATVDGAGDIEPFQITATAPAAPTTVFPAVVDLESPTNQITWTPGGADMVRIELAIRAPGGEELTLRCVVADTGVFDMTNQLALAQLALPSFDRVAVLVSPIRESVATTSNDMVVRLRLTLGTARLIQIER